MIEKSKFNALVIDIKGDRGLIPYPSKLPLAAKIGALKLRTIPDLKELVTTLKSKSIYLIARIVAFKDDLLAAAHPEWAIRTAGGGLWKDREGLAWIDPFSRRRLGLHHGVAEEAAAAGFDEIQFDYVRFPDTRGGRRLRRGVDENVARGGDHRLPARGAASGWPPTTCSWRWIPSAMSAGTRMTPASARGSRTWPTVVDIISPMLYPSGFQFGIPGYRNPVPNPYEIVYKSLEECKRRTASTAVRYRPWLQAFTDYAFGGKYFGADEIGKQTKAAARRRHRRLDAVESRATSTRPMTSSPSHGQAAEQGHRRHADALRLFPCRPDLPGRRRLRDAGDACRRRATRRAVCRRLVQPGGRRRSAPSSARRSRPATCPAPWSCWASMTGSSLRQAYGQRSVMPDGQPATLDTIYDAASLTKVMATAVAIQQLVERGQIDLDRPAAAYWPAFAANGKGDITVRQLMTHYAGLPAGIPTRGWSGSEGALDTIVGAEAGGARRHALRLQRRRFHRPGRDRAARLGPAAGRPTPPSTSSSRSACATPPSCRRPRSRDRIAPADVEGGELRWGEVQDPIAYRMGGVAGHAGAVHHRRRSHQVRADDAGGRQGRAEARLGRGHDAAAEPARRVGLARPRLGHRFALRRVVRAVLLDPLLRPYRLYRHGDLDRSRDQNLPDRAHQPPASRRQGQHPADAAAASPRSRARRRAARKPVLSGIDVLEAYGFRQLPAAGSG